MEQYAEGKLKILESALQEFAERGFAGARVDRIADAAGVNKALIYYHFKNKEELYRSTLDYLFTKIQPHVTAPTERTIKGKLSYMVAQFLKFLHDTPIFVRMMDLQALTLRNEEWNVVLKHQMQLWQAALALYEEGVASGELRDLGNPADFIIALLGACHFFYSQTHVVRSFYDQEMSSEELLDTHTRTMQEIMRRVFFNDEK